MSSDKPQVSTIEDKWSVDRKIPLALIFSIAITVIAQTGFAIWWVSGIAARVEEQNTRIVQLEQIKASERITALEALLPRVEAQLNRIEAKLDRIGHNP